MIKTIFRLMFGLLFFGILNGCTKSDPVVNTTKSINAKAAAAAAYAGPIWYVSASVASSGDGSSSAKAFKTINEAARVTGPGNTVNILAGTYTFSQIGISGQNDAVVTIDNSGTPSSPIVYQGFPGTIIKTNLGDNAGSGGINNAIIVRANYITIQNIELSGHSAAINGLSENGDAAAKYNTNGIGIGNTAGVYPTGVVVKNCKIYNFPGGGIAAKSAGNLTIDGNWIYGNCNFSLYGTSGISILTPKLVGNEGTAYGYFIGGTNTVNNIIRNNVCYNNVEYVKNKVQGVFTDGNGIIVDVNYTSSNPNGDFAGLTEVENNICYTNGGAGINLTTCQNVNVVNNFTCNNGQSAQNKIGEDAQKNIIQGHYAEVQMYTPKNVYFTNNIFYSDKNGSATSGLAYNAFTSSGGKVVFDYNIYPTGFTVPANTVYIYDGSVPSTSANTHNLAVNPSFVGPVPTTYAGYIPGAFKLNSNSPALGKGLVGSTGTPTRPYYSYFSFAVDGNNFPTNGAVRSSPINRGAY